MRWAAASLFFVISSFIFFIFFAVSNMIITETHDALDARGGDLGTGFNTILSLLPEAFLIIGVIFFLTGILLIFVLDALADEPEYYWRK